MSQRGIDFANEWVVKHIHDEPYDLPDEMVDDTVRHLISDAQAHGVGVAEIEEDMGPLRDFIASEYEKRTEEEVPHLHKDDHA